MLRLLFIRILTWLKKIFRFSTVSVPESLIENLYEVKTLSDLPTEGILGCHYFVEFSSTVYVWDGKKYLPVQMSNEYLSSTLQPTQNVINKEL